MEPFAIRIDDIDYDITLDCLYPEIFHVINPKTFHRIGKNELTGDYVALSHRPLSDPIPLKEIGQKIDEIYTR